jgi:hypothetical protein
MQSPYLARKGIELADLQRVCASKVTVASDRIAMFDANDQFQGHHEGSFVFRELVNLVMAPLGDERILDQRVDRHGQGKGNDKFVTPGTDTSGFTPIGFDPRNIMEMSGELTVCAGLAEGYRIHQATGRPVACCVGEANIPKIAQQLASFTRPDKLRISVAVDNDKAGRLAALRSGLPYAMPRREKDFSDVYQNEGGADAVRWQVEWDYEPLSAVEREREIDRLMGKTSSDYEPPMNTLHIETAGSAPLGLVGLLEVVKPHLIDGYEHFKTIATSMGAEPLCDQGHDQWLLTNADQFGLLLAMMEAGLHTSLREIPLRLPMLESHFFEAIHEGMVDDIPIPGGAPALVTLGTDSRGQCLTVDSEYDPMIAQLCKDAKGFFDKDTQQWRISVNTPQQCQRALDALADNPLRRFMFPSQVDEGYWEIATPWTRQQLAEQLPALAQEKPKAPAMATHTQAPA